MNKITNIFFDFDGVLAESVHVKTNAFYQLYLPYSQEIAEKARQHHIENGGMSRFEKFRLYHQKFLNTALDEAGLQKLATQFSQLVLNGVIESAEVPGANNFLEKYYREKNFWIITGTPTPEIEIIVKKRQMNHYFKGWYGSPEKKPYWAAYLLEKHRLNPQTTLFLGDARQDYEAAQQNNLIFALRETEENVPLFNDFVGLRFHDFDELEKKLKKQYA